MPPHYGKFIAYFRVSTDRQGKSGLGLAAQREAVMSYLDGGRWALIDEFTEIESGKRNDRPELVKAQLVIAKLDRLSRNLAFIATLMDSGVEFVAVDNPHANKLTVHILGAVAQHEREIISARTSAALKAAKTRGKRLGNPKLSEARRHATAARKDKADRYSANVLPVIRDIQRSGIGKALRNERLDKSVYSINHLTALGVCFFSSRTPAIETCREDVLSLSSGPLRGRRRSAARPRSQVRTRAVPRHSSRTLLKPR